jgi:PAS domain S-box-containing protein
MSSSIPDNTIYDVVHTSSARTLEGAFERFGNLLDAALSASTDHHAVVNREGVLLYVSLVCAHSLGQERAELIGKSISVLGYPAEATERLHLEIDTVFTRGEALSGSTETQIRDGVRVIEYALTPVFDTEGDVEAALLRARAVVREENRTASVEDALSQSVERFRILAEAMPQFVWVSDAEGRVEYVNRRWTEYTGQSVEQTGPQDDSMIHPEDASIMWERWNEAKATGADYEVEFRCRRFSDGAFRWFLARGVPLKDAQGRVIRWIGTSTDIDAQKQAEAQVSLLNNRLHRAVYESSHRIKTIPSPKILAVGE